MKDVKGGSDLDFECQKLLTAFHEYREFLKQNYPDRLAGVIWIRFPDEALLYSECSRYSEQIYKLTHNYIGDSFSLITLEQPDENQD